MSTKERITVTIDSGIAAQIKAIAGTRSTSSIVEQALRDMLQRQENARARLDQRLAEAKKENPEEFARAEAHVDEMMRKFFGEEDAA